MRHTELSVTSVPPARNCCLRLEEEKRIKERMCLARRRVASPSERDMNFIGFCGRRNNTHPGAPVLIPRTCELAAFQGERTWTWQTW